MIFSKYAKKPPEVFYLQAVFHSSCIDFSSWFVFFQTIGHKLSCQPVDWHLYLFVFDVMLPVSFGVFPLWVSSLRHWQCVSQRISTGFRYALFVLWPYPGSNAVFGKTNGGLQIGNSLYLVHVFGIKLPRFWLTNRIFGYITKIIKIPIISK